MSKVFFDISLSLDGFMAGANRGPKNPLGDDGERIHDWMFKQKTSVDIDNTLIEQIYKRAGACVIGKRMFDEGEVTWPENAPFHMPVYVLTNEKRNQWTRPGGTTFYFENEGIDIAMQKARHAAGSKDVWLTGGADVIQQYLNAGYVDEFSIHIAPIMLGKGLRLFENIKKEKFSVEIKEAFNSKLVTHIKYKITKNN